jgi:tetratricopeptide (TPR) repeat protein
VRRARLLDAAPFALLSLSALSALGCGAGSGEVVRVVDGRELPGRYVSYQAYAAYARGAELEALGDLRGAATAYGKALEADPPSVEIWMRLGALRCQLREPNADQAFRKALAIEPDYAPLHRERGRCELRRGRPLQALSELELAFKLEPNREETSLLLASAERAARRIEEAERWLTGLVMRDPTSVAGWQALHDLYAERGAEAKRARAAEMLAALGAATTRGLREEASNLERVKLDRAILASNLELTRRLAIEQRVSPAELAVRAAALGSAELALKQARWVLSADPTSSDAWVAALVAADLEHDSLAFGETLKKLDRRAVEPSPLARRLLAELVARRLGPQAQAAWEQACGPSKEPSDPLERRVQERSKKTPRD